MYKIMKKIMIVNLIIVLLVSAVGIPAQAASKTNWKNLYAKHLKKIEDLEKVYPYGEFFYVNHDNIPELYLGGNCMAAGNRLLTIYKDKVYEYMLPPNGFTYLKKQNRLHITGGRDEAYCEYVAKFSKGKMIGLGGGVFGFDVFNDGNVKFDKEGQLIYQYYWNDKSKKGTNLDQYYQNPKNGKKITKREYNKKMNRLLGADRKKYRSMLFAKTIQQIKKKLKM